MTKQPSNASCRRATRIFLVLLRLAIGWHLFIEGMVKLESISIGPSESNKPFSSRGYLQQSQGPLGPWFRRLAGDPDEEMLDRLALPHLDKGQVEKEGSQAVPMKLRGEWEEFLRRYAAHYGMDEDQRSAAQGLLQKHLDELGKWLAIGTKQIVRDYPFAAISPVVRISARVEEYRGKAAELKMLRDAWNLRFDRDVGKARISTLRGETAKLRAELQKDLDERAEKLRGELDRLLSPSQRMRDVEVFKPRLMAALRSRGYTADHQAAAGLVAAASSAGRGDLVELAQSRPEEFLSEMERNEGLKETLIRISKQNAAPPLRVEGSAMLDIADRVVAWGLTLTGLGLLVGCFARLSSLLAAGLLLLFYLAMPPLPGLPDNPMAEGKYLFVNKTLIEALALLVLATTRSGRWFGLDALLALVPPFKWFAGGKGLEGSGDRKRDSSEATAQRQGVRGTA